jgi:hypothetical protein
MKIIRYQKFKEDLRKDPRFRKAEYDSQKEVNIQKYAEVVDEDGEPIAGIVAFQVYKDALIIATKDKMYTNNPSLFPGAKGIKAITLN